MGQYRGRHCRGVMLIGLVLLLGACETRSISNSGYVGAGGYGGRSPFYRGELTEFDLLGVDVSRPASDDEIAHALDQRQTVGVRRGDAIMVIQSGALIPDDAMVKELERYFSVMPFTGVTMLHDRPLYAAPGSALSATAADERVNNYARALRLAAAKSGADVIFCYWGMVESAVEREPTKAVSWVPIVGSAIPDEAQVMRIRLKVALIDVRTGHWSMFVPASYVDTSLSASMTRAASDQRQVETLKQQAYQSAVEAFLAKYAG